MPSRGQQSVDLGISLIKSRPYPLVAIIEDDLSPKLDGGDANTQDHTSCDNPANDERCRRCQEAPREGFHYAFAI